MQLDVIGENLCAVVTACAFAQSGHHVRLLVAQDEEGSLLLQGQCIASENDLVAVFEQEFGKRLSVVAEKDVQQSGPIVFMALQPGDFERLEHHLKRLAAQPVLMLVNQTGFAVGTSESIQQQLTSLGSDCVVITLPDLIQEGAALQSFVRPDHILLGCKNERAEQIMRELLRPYNRRRDVIQVMQPREAEFAKLAISGMLATRLSLMNDLANLAEKLDVDIEIIRQSVGSDPRIGEAYLYPGCGFGGPGFSRDVLSLTETLKQGNQSSGLLESVMAINEKQKEVLFRKFWQYFKGDVANKKVAIWGVAFKPGSDKVDNAPSLPLLKAFWAQGVETRVHDPRALVSLRKMVGSQPLLVLCDDAMEAAKGCDALLLVTEWKCYWGPDWQALKQQLAHPLILDGRNIYQPDYVRSQGFEYQGIGRN